MNLRDKVLKQIPPCDGEYIIARDIITIVLDEAIDIIHSCNYLDAIDKHDLETDIKKLKGER